MNDVTTVLDKCQHTIGEASIIAVGLLKKVSERQFHFLVKCLPALLRNLDVPNKILQSRTASFQNAIRVIHEVKEMVEEMRSEDCFNSVWNQLIQVSYENYISYPVNLLILHDPQSMQVSFTQSHFTPSR